jgi:hypothetical protein
MALAAGLAEGLWPFMPRVSAFERSAGAGRPAGDRLRHLPAVDTAQ